MVQNWRISSFNGVLLACYFIPTWTIVAFKIMISPIHGLYDRPNISMALFFSDHMQVATMSTIRFAWLLAVGKLTVVAFFAVFLAFATRRSIRQAGGCDEPLALAIGIASVISFISMMMASRVGEAMAMRLHVTELLLLLGTAVLMAVEPATVPTSADDRAAPGPACAAYPVSSPSS